MAVTNATNQREKENRLCQWTARFYKLEYKKNLPELLSELVIVMWASMINTLKLKKIFNVKTDVSESF